MHRPVKSDWVTEALGRLGPVALRHTTRMDTNDQEPPGLPSLHPVTSVFSSSLTSKDDSTAGIQRELILGRSLM